MPFWTISHHEQGSSLLIFLKQQFSYCSKRAIKLALEHGACKINEQVERFSSTRLCLGDKVEFSEHLLAVQNQKKSCFDDKLILFENAFLIAYLKPSGQTTEQLHRVLIQYDPQLFSVHRLDKETSGIILFAKGVDNQAKIENLFRLRRVEKTYLAIVDRKVNTQAGDISNFLGKVGCYQGQTIWGEVSKERGQLAQTSWTCMCTNEEASLLICRPKTGRTHQLRVHLSGMGHPILGDYQYGKKFSSPYQPSRQLLHAFGLSLPMETGKILNLTAPVPEDFNQAILALDLKLNIPQMTQDQKLAFRYHPKKQIL